MNNRCGWAGDDPLMHAYHDREWGVPVHEDTKLFEFLILEGAQAGLSWRTVLHKRERYRDVFDGFDATRIAKYNARKVERLLADPGIIRNRAKIEATILGARTFLAIQEETGSFDRWIWSLVDRKITQNRWKAMSEIPASTEASDRMAKELKKRGFKFVGTTICYAFMQATGMVNDHLVTCPRHADLAKRKR